MSRTLSVDEDLSPMHRAMLTAGDFEQFYPMENLDYHQRLLSLGKTLSFSIGRTADEILAITNDTSMTSVFRMGSAFTVTISPGETRPFSPGMLRLDRMQFVDGSLSFEERFSEMNAELARTKIHEAVKNSYWQQEDYTELARCFLLRGSCLTNACLSLYPHDQTWTRDVFPFTTSSTLQIPPLGVEFLPQQLQAWNESRQTELKYEARTKCAFPVTVVQTLLPCPDHRPGCLVAHFGSFYTLTQQQVQNRRAYLRRPQKTYNQALAKWRVLWDALGMERTLRFCQEFNPALLDPTNKTVPMPSPELTAEMIPLPKELAKIIVSFHTNGFIVKWRFRNPDD